MDYKYATLICPTDSDDWYALYSAIDPATGKMRRKRTRDGINRIKSLRERKKEGILLCKGINEKLDAGWNPWVKGNEKKIQLNKDKQNFFWWFGEKIAHEKARGDSGYANHKNLVQVKNKLESFVKVLQVSDFDYKFILDFETFLLEQKNSLNNIAFVMAKLRVITAIIVDNGDIPYHKNPFLKYRSKTTPIKPKRLTLEQIELIRNADLYNKGEILARDMYIFSFYTAGMRFGDICRAKKEWFENGNTTYIMHKSNKARVIKIMPQAKEIIDRYINTEGAYLFPLGIKWEDQAKQIEAKNAYYNLKLKKVCNAVEVPEISFHTSRHSVADLTKKMGMDVHTAKELLGHSKVATTERYLKMFYEEETGAAMEKLFGAKDEK